MVHFNQCLWFSRKAISKSLLERYEKSFDENLVADKIHHWMSELSEEKKALKAGLAMPVSFKRTFMDSTCIKANIHFPVDWVLLRDASRSLLKVIQTIHTQGLK